MAGTDAGHPAEHGLWCDTPGIGAVVDGPLAGQVVDGPAARRHLVAAEILKKVGLSEGVCRKTYQANQYVKFSHEC